MRLQEVDIHKAARGATVVEMLVGYARISTDDMDIGGQVELLKASLAASAIFVARRPQPNVWIGRAPTISPSHPQR